MNARYVISIAGELLYFDEQRQPTAPFPHEAAAGNKPALKLVAPAERPASRSEWDQALERFSEEQRAAAEISDATAGR